MGRTAGIGFPCGIGNCGAASGTLVEDEGSGAYKCNVGTWGRIAGEVAAGTPACPTFFGGHNVNTRGGVLSTGLLL